MTPFDFLSADRIRFGRGVAQESIAAVLSFGARVLLVHGRSAARAAWLHDALKEAGAGVLSVPCPGEPTLALLRSALAEGRDARPDVIVGLGGGATLDLAKALAALIPSDQDPLHHLEVVGQGQPLVAPPLPFVAIPTTAGTGSEVTKNAVIGVPEHRRKVSLRDDRMRARLAIIDPALTDGAPLALTLSCGLDAVTQVIEPFLSRRASPLTDALCRDAVPRGLAALARLVQGEDTSARDDLAFVSLCGGLALANAGLGAVHGLAGVVGGRCAAPHGAICGALLPHALIANRSALAPDSQAAHRIQQVDTWMLTHVGKPIEGFAAWSHAMGLPRFADMGPDPASFADISRAAQASSSMRPNPVDLDADALRWILTAAYEMPRSA